jgi:hypothetical protein
MPTTTLDNNEIRNVHCNASMALERSKLALESKKYAIPLDSLRIFDSASNAVLPNTAASDDLALIIGTQGTTGLSVRSSDGKATTITQKARFRFLLPAEYPNDGAISIVAHAGMLTTVSDTTATIDFSAYSKNIADFTHSADLVTTSATSINSLTLSAKSFVVTPTGLANGDELDVLATIAITDGATATAVLGIISQLYLLIDCRG